MKFDLGRASKHILFWLLYLSIWSIHDLSYNTGILENLKTNSVPFMLYALLVYFNLYILIPKFLLKRKIASYILLLTGMIFLFTMVASQYLSFYFQDIEVSTATFFLSIRGKIAVFTELLITLCLSMTLFLIDEWFRKEQMIKEMENERMHAALELSKSNNVNPHFLLNPKSNIYTIIDKKLPAEEGDNHIFIKSDGMVIKVFINEITHIETANDYVYINTVHKERYLTLVSLKQISQKLPAEKFIRVHRYYLIGIAHVRKLEGNLIHIGKTKIKISRALKNQVYESIIGNKLVER